MKGKWQVIFGSLLLQAVVGIIIVNSVLNGINGPIYNGTSLVLGYLFMALSLSAAGYLILYHVLKQPKALAFRCTLLSGMLWILGPVIFVVCYNQVSTLFSKDYNDIAKEKTIEAAKHMGIKSYSWNSTVKQCVVELENGERQSFFLNGNLLHIYCNLPQASKEDTLAWLKLTLDEAASYLDSKAFNTMDSCIKAGNYYFKSYAESPKIELAIYPFNNQSYRERINGESIEQGSDKYSQGNFHITLNYERQSKNAVE